MPAEMLVQLNGWVEVCLAVMLMFGAYTRFAAVILTLHLAGIAAEVGGAIGVRDAALAAVGVSLALADADVYTLDAVFAKK